MGLAGAEMLDYNVPGGKLNHGLSVVDSLKLLKEGGELTDDEVFQSCALGWCIEWLQAYFLVLDDIMDGSHTRRGQPCWFRLPKIYGGDAREKIIEAIDKIPLSSLVMENRGLGTLKSASQLLESLSLPNIKWICPTAPTCLVAILGGYSCTACFEVGELSEDGPDDWESLDASAAHIANLLAAEPADVKVGIGGFSMGAASSLFCNLLCYG